MKDSADYNQTIAMHYAAFRPNLHLPILKKCLYPKTSFNLGLDVGCGTGQSTLALAQICKKVVGIDPSKAMLQKAIPHNKITYDHCNGKDLFFSDDCFDVITFAGSLFYAKSQHLLNDTLRICTSMARIVVYDFEILLDDLLLKLGVTPPTKSLVNYDHSTNFSGLNTNYINLRSHGDEQSSLDITSANLAHLLLSDKEHYTRLENQFGKADLYNTLVTRLQSLVPKGTHQIPAHWYYSVYSCAKK